MFKVSDTIAGLATLALACVPAFAMSTNAFAAPAKVRTMMTQMAREVRSHVEANFDYVGDAFAREARDIHEGKSEERGIYGEATPKDVKKLVEDGVPVAPLPPKPEDLN